MTQELINSINTLLEENKFDEIISLIEKLPEKEKNYQAKLFLANAYYDIADDFDDYDNSKNLEKILQILLSVSDEGESDIRWLNLIAKTYYNLNKEEVALEYFERVKRICQKDPEIADNLFVEQFIDSCNNYIKEKAIHIIQNAFSNFYTGKELNFIHNKEEKDLQIEVLGKSTNYHIIIKLIYKNHCKIEYNYKHLSTTDTKNIAGYGNNIENAVLDSVYKYMDAINPILK